MNIRGVRSVIEVHITIFLRVTVTMFVQVIKLQK